MKKPFGSKFKVGLILDTYLKNSRAEFKASSGPIQQLQPVAFSTLICLLRHKAWLKLLWMKNMCILQLVYYGSWLNITSYEETNRIFIHYIPPN
jgi:hypothetical protein